MGPPVLDVPGDQHKVMGEVVLVLAGVVVGCITGSRNHCGGGAEEGRGRWGGGGDWGCVLCCVLWGAPAVGCWVYQV